MMVKVNDKVNIKPLLAKKGFPVVPSNSVETFHFDEKNLHKFVRLVSSLEQGHVIVIRSPKQGDGEVSNVLSVIRPPTSPDDPCYNLLQSKDG
jgi:hypothetical protein